jgi:hypothetical protein
MERVLVRLLLLAAPFVCAFQYWVLTEYPEPYPILIMPGFGRVLNGQTHDHPTVALLRDGRTLSTHAMAELFEGVPAPNRVRLTSTVLHWKSRQPVTPTLQDWARRHASRMNPNADTLAVRWHRHTISSKDEPEWLGDFLIPLSAE